MLSNILLPVFFLYFVLISGYCSSLLNCSLQRFMKSSVYFKHFLIILSIYIFTFILSWYRFDSLTVDRQEGFQVKKNENTINEFSLVPLKKLGVWFLYTMAIYLIFLISTKSEVIYIIIFFVFIIIAIMLQIIIKSLSSESYNKVNEKFFITEQDYNGPNKKFILAAHNGLTIGFCIVMLLLFIGFIQYFTRQYRDHRENWSFRLFLFGTNTCREV